MFIVTRNTRLVLETIGSTSSVQQRNLHQLPQIPHRLNEGIDGFLSSRSLMMHVKDVHFGLVNKLNKLTDKKTLYWGCSIPKILTMTAQDNASALTHNIAADCFNHEFFWQTLRANPNRYEALAQREDGQLEPSKTMKVHFDVHFGGYEALQRKFKESVVTTQGSGWTYLVSVSDHMQIVNFRAGAPLTFGRNVTPLFCLDAYEHSYVHDYGTDVDLYVDNFFKAINWKFVEINMIYAQRKQLTDSSIDPEEFDNRFDFS
mmetsp:Transcript_17227/g.25616  ORF Transcript_17227/g.25616 Transcript_17227/m.25616 type:complete len:260 (+) Transcript_17227:61-840(+)